jgi:hypothetical protein
MCLRTAGKPAIAVRILADACFLLFLPLHAVRQKISYHRNGTVIADPNHCFSRFSRQNVGLKTAEKTCIEWPASVAWRPFRDGRLYSVNGHPWDLASKGLLAVWRIIGICLTRCL